MNNKTKLFWAALLAVGVAAALCCRGAETNLLVGNVGNYGLAAQTGVVATLTLNYPNPRTVGGVLVRQEPMQATSSAAGAFYFTNIQWGRYTLTLSGRNPTPFVCWVGTNTSGTVSIASLATNASALPPNPATNYYTIPQVDALLVDSSSAATAAGYGVTVATNGTVRTVAVDTNTVPTLDGYNEFTGMNRFDSANVFERLRVIDTNSVGVFTEITNRYVRGNLVVPGDDILEINAGLEGYLKWATGLDPTMTIDSGENNSLTLRSDGDITVRSTADIVLRTNVTTVGNLTASNFFGKTETGSLTNASGSRVAFLSDTGGAATNSIANTNGFGTNTTLYGTTTIESNNVSVMVVTNITLPAAWNGGGATNVTASRFNGQLSPTNYNAGTGAGVTTYLRGDGTWAAIAGGGSSNITDAAYVALINNAIIKTNLTLTNGTLTVSGSGTNILGYTTFTNAVAVSSNLTVAGMLVGTGTSNYLSGDLGVGNDVYVTGSINADGIVAEGAGINLGGQWLDAWPNWAQLVTNFYYRTQSVTMSHAPSISLRANSGQDTNDIIEFVEETGTDNQVPFALWKTGYNRLFVFNTTNTGFSPYYYAMSPEYASQMLDAGQEGWILHAIQVGNPNGWSSTNAALYVWTNASSVSVGGPGSPGAGWGLVEITNGAPRRNYHECVLLRPGYYHSIQHDLEGMECETGGLLWFPQDVQTLQSKVPLWFGFDGTFPAAVNDFQGWNCFPDRNAPFIALTGPGWDDNNGTNAMRQGQILQTVFEPDAGWNRGGVNKRRYLRGTPASPVVVGNSRILWDELYEHWQGAWYTAVNLRVSKGAGGMGKYQVICDNSAENTAGLEVIPLTVNGDSNRIEVTSFHATTASASNYIAGSLSVGAALTAPTQTVTTAYVQNLVGSGVGLTNVPASGLASTNAASAGGQGYLWPGYWGTVAGGSGDYATRSAFPTNAVLTNAIATAGSVIATSLQATNGNTNILGYTTFTNAVAVSSNLVVGGTVTGNGSGLTNIPNQWTNYMLDCSSALQTYTIGPSSLRVPTVLIKSNANYNAEIIVNGVTNSVSGALAWIDLQPIQTTNWVIRW